MYLYGSMDIEAPAGWIVEPDSTPFSLEGEGAETRLVFRVQPGAAGQGTFVLRPVARSEDGGAFSTAVEMIDYPHIDSWGWASR